ncbi:MAG: hypothetical protein GTO45_19075 [Candidatus Aminicenantes bacterium]|nr:hypothetical protein [Candidatus Aminicenantes bacterium]NIM80891.1 hypothetical protein [Candidatus Aminicenantes bacterium]NIN20275.1 hypothetical protein [Candidatus Aminicenantes bacterium]NIN44054.1 hypothetical protein [Candidatus Aminicenantes bacterium]NIN86864.1 hypothetical protein [Candidatus Aminicenantes bacterium]
MAMKEEIFQFHISLIDSEPLIWRSFQVHSNITFHEFHYIIQDVMGWEAFHPYEFRFKKHGILMPDSDINPYQQGYETYADETNLFDVFKRVGQKFRYIYDFGDNWEHEIIFEKRLPVEENQVYPVCIDGEMACPLEDIGGIWDFYNKLAIARGEEEYDDEEHVEFLKNFLEDYDPEYFNLDEINDRLQQDLELEIDEDFYLEEKIDQYLDMVDRPFRLDDCLEKLNLETTEENEAEVFELIETSGDVLLDMDDGLFYPKVYFLKDFAIRIMPTDYEIQKGILIPGHRLLPFLPAGKFSDEVTLIYNNKALDDKDIILTESQLYPYFDLLDSDEVPIIEAGTNLDEENQFSLIVFDLSRFYRENHFVQGDSIILTMEDIFESVFHIHYDPIANITARKEEIKTWDNLFIESLKRVLRANIENSYLEKQLMYTYFYMSRCLTQEQKKIPGTEVGVLLKRSKEIRFSDIEDTGKILHFADQFVVYLSHSDS